MTDGASRFDGKVAFVTGGAIGLGRAVADALAREGASVVIADVDEARADATAVALDEAHGSAISVACDVADESSVENAVAVATERFGGIDILVNNAALHLSRFNKPFSVMPSDDVRALFDVNVLGVVYCSVACGASMRERGGGAIVNVASAAGFRSTTAYGVSKLAVRGLTIAFASDFGHQGIRVNAIAPTLINTESAMEARDPATLERQIHERQVIHRLGTVDDAVAVALFLCSDDAGFVTGETIRVTGGAWLAI